MVPFGTRSVKWSNHGDGQQPQTVAEELAAAFGFCHVGPAKHVVATAPRHSITSATSGVAFAATFGLPPQHVIVHG